MSNAKLQDYAKLVTDTFVHPNRALAAVTARKSFVPALAVTTAAALAFAAAVAPRLDFERAAIEQLAKGPEAADMTPHQREEELTLSRKIGIIGTYASALLMPTLGALAIACFLWLGFKVAGSTPGFPATLATTSYALLPGALASVLSLPAAFTHPSIRVEEIRLLPSSMAALLPAGTTGPLAALFGAIDVFSLWSLALLVIGMVGVAKVSRARATVVCVVLWASYVAVVKVAIPSLRAGAMP